LNYKKKVTDALLTPQIQTIGGASLDQNNVNSINISSSSRSNSNNNLSLLKRIQQAKKQKYSYGSETDSLQDDFRNTPPFENFTSSSPVVASDQNYDEEYEFSSQSCCIDAIDNNGHDDRTTLSEINPNGNVQMRTIPDYSASDNIRNDHYSSYNEDSSGSDHRAGYQLLSALTTVGNAVGFMAKSVFYGTRNLYNTVIIRNNNRQSQGSIFTSQQRMHEMDYQRESLLLDPHEVEDGSFLPMENASPLGLNAMRMMGSSNNVVVSSTSTGRRHHPLIGCLSQFCVDVRDIFMGLSRNKKLAVIAFVAFLLWLFISEERHNHHTQT
jgi:hypothetical protein